MKISAVSMNRKESIYYMEMMYLVGMNGKDKEYMIKKSRHFAVPAGSYSQEKSIKLSYRGF